MPHSPLTLLADRPMRRISAAAVCLFFCYTVACSQEIGAHDSKIAYDMGEAREICDALPLEPVEGIWLYPDDNVTVTVLRTSSASSSSFSEYGIYVVEAEDCGIVPGDKIGTLTATPQPSVFSLQLFTERKDKRLLKPRTCVATLSKEGDYLTFKQPQGGIKFRLGLNATRLLPQFWRIVRISASPGSQEEKAPVGMIKTYPSYDGNGSSRRTPRYL